MTPYQEASRSDVMEEVGEGFAGPGSAWTSVSDSPSYVSPFAAPPHFLNPSKTKKRGEMKPRREEELCSQPRL